MRSVVIALAIAAGPAVTGAHAAQASTGAVPLRELPPPEGPARSFQVRGWTRTSLEATWPVNDDDGDQRLTAVPHDEVLARELLYARARYSRGRSFEAVGSALLTSGFFQRGGSFRPNGSSRANVRAELRDAYLAFLLKRFDIRAGIQRIAWGHGDIFSPNDVVNSKDLRDPILSETELRHVPSLAVRGDVALAGGSLRLVAQPIFESDRYDVYGSNWALVQPDAPAGYRGLLGLLIAQTGMSNRNAADALLMRPARPHGLSGTQAGLRFDWRAGRFDVTHYYHYGYHGMPNFRITPVAVAALDAVDWTTASVDQVDTIVTGLRGVVGATWQRRQHVGLDIGTTAGPFVLRVDAAYQQPALFYDRALNGWLSPAIETAVGLEYQTGSLGRTISIEGRHRHIWKDLPDGGLLYADRDSVDAAVLARWTWANVEAETRGVVGVRPGSLVLRPQISWKARSLRITSGVVILHGTARSYGDWYRRNRSIYLVLRKDF
jgi:hypothetical protein